MTLFGTFGLPASAPLQHQLGSICDLLRRWPTVIARLSLQVELAAHPWPSVAIWPPMKFRVVRVPPVFLRVPQPAYTFRAPGGSPVALRGSHRYPTRRPYVALRGLTNRRPGALSWPLTASQSGSRRALTCCLVLFRQRKVTACTAGNEGIDRAIQKKTHPVHFSSKRVRLLHPRGTLLL